MEKAITKVFLECQTSMVLHTKLIKRLKNIYLKSDFDKFLEHFIHLTKFSLIYEEKHPVVERTLAFVAKFSTSCKLSDDEKTKSAEKEDDDDCDVDPFLVGIFKFLLKNHEANSRAVRLRVCQLINKILNSMGEQASIDDQLYNTIYDTMLQRLMDKIPSVRVQAIHALSRLQDPRNKDCPVIKAYLFHLSMDPSPEVRKAVLFNIAITFQTLPDILDRIRDTRDVVRRQTYLTLAQKVHFRSFTIAQRILIASEGLNDRSDMVRQVVRRNLLQAWLRLLNGSILELLKCLDVEASTDCAELVLKSLFEDVPYSTLVENFNLLDSAKLVPFDQLKPEAALYWKNLAKHLKSEKAEEYLDEFLPDLTAFCTYVKKWMQISASQDEEIDPQETAVKMMEREFICQQLVDLAQIFDLSDEVGRHNLRKLVFEMLQSPRLGEMTIKSLSEIFVLLYPPVTRITQLAEIISDLREPPDKAPQEASRSPCNRQHLSEEERHKKKLKIAKLSVKINQVKDDLEECVRSLDLDRARELKEVLEELEVERKQEMESGPLTTPHAPQPSSRQLRNAEDEEDELKQLDDPETLSRCLLLVCEFLTSPQIDHICSTLRSLHDNLVLPCLKSEDLGVRRYAVRALGVMCLLSKELAQQHLLLFVQISQMDAEEIQSEALRSLFDFWLLYGLEEFNSAAEDIPDLPGFGTVEEPTPGGQAPNVGNMIALLSKMLESESHDARTLSAEGLCKLLLASRICSSKLLSHLVLLWYNPNTEDDHLLRHILGVFFPFYASLGGSNQESLCGALLPTVHTLFDAPARSPLSDVDVEDVVSFMVSITSPSIVSSKAEPINAHDSLVFTICAEVLSFPDRDYARALVRSLSQLTLSPTNFTTLRQVLCLIQKMIKKFEEKRLLNYVYKFRNSIESALQTAPNLDQDDADQTDDVALDDNETANASHFKRKRVLYSSQSEGQFMSDLSASELNSSDTDRSPSKTRRLSEDAAATIVPNEDRLKKTTVLETEEDDSSGTVKSMAVYDTNGSSSIIVMNDAEIELREENVTEEEEEKEETLRRSPSESPPKKSPKLKREKSVRDPSQGSPSSPSSTSSFYSARSTSPISSEIFSPAEGPSERQAEARRPVTRASLGVMEGRRRRSRSRSARSVSASNASSSNSSSGPPPSSSGQRGLEVLPRIRTRSRSSLTAEAPAARGRSNSSLDEEDLSGLRVTRARSVASKSGSSGWSDTQSPCTRSRASLKSSSEEVGSSESRRIGKAKRK